MRGTITSSPVIAFVRHLWPWIPGAIFLCRDGLPIHRSKKTRAALPAYHPRLRVYRLPAEAPELNPDEDRGLGCNSPPALHHARRTWKFSNTACASPGAAADTGLTSSAPSSVVALPLFDHISTSLYRYP